MTGLLLNLNFAATAASLLILIVKYILRKKTTPRWQLLIWAVLAVQLIVFPFAEKLPESGLSLRNYLPKASVSENAGLNAAELKENINDVRRDKDKCRRREYRSGTGRHSFAWQRKWRNL